MIEASAKSRRGDGARLHCSERSVVGSAQSRSSNYGLDDTGHREARPEIISTLVFAGRADRLDVAAGCSRECRKSRQVS